MVGSLSFGKRVIWWYGWRESKPESAYKDQYSWSHVCDQNAKEIHKEDLGAKLEYLELLTKAGLNWKQIVTSLTMIHLL